MLDHKSIQRHSCLLAVILIVSITTSACGSLLGSEPGNKGIARDLQDIDIPLAVMTEQGPLPTAQPSLTHTATPIPPTETDTPLPPTLTPTPIVPMAKVTYNGAVNIRQGACNQPVLTTASLGMEFPVTGLYTAASGEVWWRIQLPDGSQGWIWGDLVDVTHEALVPPVPSQCPPFPTITPTPTETQIVPPTTAVVHPPVGLPACQTKITGVQGIEGINYIVRPRVVEGDREFAGHGPEVKVIVVLAHNDHTADVRITMWARETAADWTTAEGDTGWMRLFTAPSGWRIRTMNLNQVDTATGIHYSKWLYQYTDDDHDLDVFDPQDGGPLGRIVVRGDTEGEDVGLSDGYSTRAFVWFHSPIRVELIQEGNCQ